LVPSPSLAKEWLLSGSLVTMVTGGKEEGKEGKDAMKRRSDIKEETTNMLRMGRVVGGLLILSGIVSILTQIIVIGYSHEYEVMLGEGITGGIMFLVAGAAGIAAIKGMQHSRAKQVLLLVVLLVSLLMSGVLVVLSGLHLLALPHDLTYLHHGELSLLQGLYSTLTGAGVLAGLSTLILLIMVCLSLPHWAHNKAQAHCHHRETEEQIERRRDSESST